MPDVVSQFVWPVWGNTYWARSCLELYEGVGKHADELNVKHAHFFGLVQKLSLDAVTLEICKLFDRDKGKYKLDTIPGLIDYLQSHLTPKYVSRLRAEILTSLGAEEHIARDVVIRLQDKKEKADFVKARTDLCELLSQLMPTWDSPALNRLKTYRDKRVAHQEQLSETQKDQLKSLPSISDMETVITWAENFCSLMTYLLSNGSLGPHGASARIAALNVAAKLLDKHFDDTRDPATYRERETFYSRIQ